MHLAAREGHTATVLLLLEQGLDIGEKNTVCKPTLLYMYASCFDIMYSMHAGCLHILPYLSGRQVVDNTHLRLLRMCYYLFFVFFKYLSPAILTLCRCRMDGPPCTMPPPIVIRPPSPFYWSRGQISRRRPMYASKHLYFGIFLVCTFMLFYVSMYVCPALLLYL